MNGRVVALNQSLTANQFRMVLEARDFDSVISEGEVVHLVPIEVRDEKQFGLAWPKKIYGVVPIATGCCWSWALNHDGRSMHMRRNYAEEWNGNIEKIF